MVEGVCAVFKKKEINKYTAAISEGHKNILNFRELDQFAQVFTKSDCL